jgi:hypothetical protein
MTILEWEIEPWQFGKDKDFTISLLVMSKMEMLMKSRTLTTQMILKVFGLLFTIHTAKLKIKLEHSLNMETKISKM